MGVKFGLQFAGFNEAIKRLEAAGGNVQAAAEAALKETHRIVTEKADAVMIPANMPAGGDYWTGRTEQSLVRAPKVTWQGSVASVDVGFDTRKGGLASIFLLRGTPYHEPLQELVDAFYGDQTMGEVMAAQKKIFDEAMEKL